jgi:hypothetical protein
VDSLGTALGSVFGGAWITIETANSTIGEDGIYLDTNSNYPDTNSNYPVVKSVFYTSEDCTGTPIVSSAKLVARGANGQFYISRKAHQFSTPLLIKSQSSFEFPPSNITTAAVQCIKSNWATSGTYWVGVPYTLPPEIENATWPANRVQAP